MGDALFVVRAQRNRAKRGKGKYEPVAPYRCACGEIHLASARRVSAYEYGGMVTS